MQPPISEIIRLFTNIHTLLNKGQFPGEIAPALVESIDFISMMIKETTDEQARQQEAEGIANRESSGDSQNSAGMGSSGVHDPG